MSPTKISPTKDQAKPFHVAVCGGGIGGLCMAIGLIHQNIPVKIYEAAPAFAEIGAGVSFGPNSVRAMELIDEKIKTAYDTIATQNGWQDKGKTWFDFSIGVKDGPDGWKDMAPHATVEKGFKEGAKIAEVQAGNVGQSSVHRAHFLDALVKLIPDGVAEFGKRVEQVEQKGERMQITFHDGSTAEADAVIGCDGVKSRTRQILLGEDHETTRPSFTGKYAYRGLIPMEKAIKAVGEELAVNSQMYMGPHSHILTFPIEKGKTMNVVAFQTKKDGKWEDDKWVLPMRMEDMYNDFYGWGEKAQHILSLMEKPDKWALFDHPPAPIYYKGRFAILGDAAHASTPHQGAGAGQAIEDAFVLSNLLGQVKYVSEIEKAFHAYDAVRRPRSQKVVTTSREAAELYEFENEMISMDLDAVKEKLNSRFDWIWNEDLPEQLREAQGIMGEKANL